MCAMRKLNEQWSEANSVGSLTFITCSVAYIFFFLLNVIMCWQHKDTTSSATFIL